MIDEQLGVHAEQAVQKRLAEHIAFAAQGTARHVAHRIHTVRPQFFRIPFADAPEIGDRAVFPQLLAIALFVELGDAHAVFIGGHMLGDDIHRHLAEV